ncbi:MAG: hypothetical protein EOL87_09370 [Spartobacteria bacterium]|nr:hypothetical protein [Spartobacteria bacterium]
MKSKWAVIVGMFLYALVLTGCNTTDGRIKKNQVVFDSLDPDIQELIKQGQVDIGFTEEMVFMAWGQPDRVYIRKTAESSRTVWSYTDSYTTSSRQRVDGTFRVRLGSGEYRTVRDSIWVDVDQGHEYEQRRIEYVDGFVDAIETAEYDGLF